MNYDFIKELEIFNAINPNCAFTFGDLFKLWYLKVKLTFHQVITMDFYCSACGKLRWLGFDKTRLVNDFKGDVVFIHLSCYHENQNEK